MPRVTVVVPNFNHARFLPQRLAAIERQTFRDVEVILLDDCSTDDSRTVLGEFARTSKFPVRTHFNSANSGSPFKQWRLGAEMAAGELLWIAESDDDADPRLLETAIERMDRHPGVGLVYCQSRIIDEAGADCGDNLGYTEPIEAGRWAADFVNGGRDECARYMCRINTIPNASAVVVRRDLFRSTDRADEEMRLAGDWLSWAKILLATDVAFVAEPLNRFRVHRNTVRRTTDIGRMLDESSRVRLFLSDAFAGDAQVQRRLLDATVEEWRRWASHIEDRESLAWYRRYRSRLRRFGSLGLFPVDRLYFKYRFLHLAALSPLREAMRRRRDSVPAGR